MNQLTTLLKDKHVLWAIVIAILSVLQGFAFEFPLTPVPYAQLTQAEVVSWIEDLVGAQMREQADAELAAYQVRSQNQLNTGTPWNQG
jgi:hypothetical protein